MMKLSLASQATSPSTVATPWPRPNLLPRRSIVTSRRSWSPGVTTCLKRHSSMAAKRPSRSPKPGCWATKMPIVWAKASIWRTPGMIGWPGKWPWKNHSVAVTDLRPTIRFASASYSTIRSTSRNGQRCGSNFSIWRVVRMVVLVAAVSVTGGSWVRVAGLAVARGDERGAAYSVQQAGGHLAIDKDLIGKDGSMQLDVGDDAVHEQLAEGRIGPSNSQGPVWGPHG